MNADTGSPNESGQQETDESTASHPRFSSRTGFLLAAAGSSIGLGNIWRFPFVTGENGGGAFLLPYVIALLLIGIPVMILEFALGRSTGKGVVGAFSDIAHRFRLLGMLIALLTLLLLSYYLVVAGWAIGYFTLGIVNSQPQFDDFTSGGNSITFFLVGTLITIIVVRLGVNSGIERFSKVLMPALIVLLLGLMIYSLTLSGLDEAVDFYLAPDFGSLGNGTVWVRAIGQVFFSVGVGGGILITYGAYMHKSENIVSSAAIVAVGDFLIAFVAGLIIFPIVFTFGSTPSAGPQLAFDTLPLAFGSFNPVAGYLVGLLFYASLSVAALTSAIALLQTGMVAMQEFAGYSRQKSLVIASSTVLALGLLSALSYTGGLDLRIAGERFLDLMDTSIGTIALPIAVLITVMIVGWFGSGWVREGLGRWGRWESVVFALAKWAAPAAIVALLVAMALDLLLGRIVPETAG